MDSTFVFSKSPPIILSSLLLFFFIPIYYSNYSGIKLIMHLVMPWFHHCRFTSLETTRLTPTSSK